MQSVEELGSVDELTSNLAEYRSQREAVTALLVQDPENEEYKEMASGLDEVIEMTQDLLEAAREQSGSDPIAPAATTAPSPSCPPTTAPGCPPPADLHAAARLGDLASLTALLAEEGSQVNCKDRLKRTPLHLACWAGHAVAVEYLIGCGAAVKMEAGDGVTALHFACQKGHVDVAKLLIASGASVKAFSSKAVTPLHCAAQTGNLELVKLLLKKNADPNSTNKQGKTPADLTSDEEIHLAIEEHLKTKEAEAKVKESKEGSDVTGKAKKESNRKGNRRSKAEVNEDEIQNIEDVEVEKIEFVGGPVAADDQPKSKKRKKSKQTLASTMCVGDEDDED